MGKLSEIALEELLIGASFMSLLKKINRDFYLALARDHATLLHERRTQYKVARNHAINNEQYERYLILI
jgi:hypothetical protein